MNGAYGAWDVDDFESQRIRDPKLRKLWGRSMGVCGLPETWAGL